MNTSTRSAIKSTYAPLLNRAALSAPATVEQMADDMRVFAASGAAITAADLELLGYTDAQIVMHSRAARQRAIALAATR